MPQIDKQQFGEMVGAVKTNTNHVQELRADMKIIKEETLPEMEKKSIKRYDKLKYLILATTASTIIAGYDTKLIQDILAFIGNLFT